MKKRRNPLKSRKSSPLRVISLYTGVGGLDYGFEAAGFRTAVAVEMDAAACRMIRANRSWPVLEDDIHKVSSKAILSTANLRVRETDVLIGGPPCQPFSKAGYWKRGDALRLDDPRASTLEAFLRVLRDTKPRAFLLENVPGLAFSSKSEGLDFLLSGIEQVNKAANTNYKARWELLNAADYGVPQVRERLFLVGSRDGTVFDFPKAMFSAPQTNQDPDVAYRNAWDAIGDLADSERQEELVIRGRWGALLPSIPEGQNYLWHTSRGGGQPLFGWRTRYWSFLLKLAKNRPAWTVQAQPGTAIGPFHWRNRRLSARELCRLQTFPDDIQLACGRNDVQRLLGNAVPSLLAEHLAREIRRQLLRRPARSRGFQLLPPRREDCPPAEPLADVPAEYASLLGEHPDHPGEGKGVGAMRRHKEQRDLFEESEPEAA